MIVLRKLLIIIIFIAQGAFCFEKVFDFKELGSRFNQSRLYKSQIDNLNVEIYSLKQSLEQLSTKKYTVEDIGKSNFFDLLSVAFSSGNSFCPDVQFKKVESGFEIEMSNRFSEKFTLRSNDFKYGHVIGSFDSNRDSYLKFVSTGTKTAGCTNSTSNKNECSYWSTMEIHLDSKTYMPEFIYLFVANNEDQESFQENKKGKFWHTCRLGPQ